MFICGFSSFCSKFKLLLFILVQGWWNDLLLENNYKEVDYSGKMVLLLDILAMCADVGDKALVFSQSILTLDLIEYYLSKLSRHGKKGKCWKQGKDWYRYSIFIYCSASYIILQFFFFSFLFFPFLSLFYSFSYPLLSCIYVCRLVLL